MHIEPGIVVGAKMVLSYATAAGAKSAQNLTQGRLFNQRLHKPG